MVQTFREFQSSRLEELCKTPRCSGDTLSDYDFIVGLLELVNLVKPRSVIEIGCWKGVSTEVFLLSVQRVLAIDPWDYPDGIFDEFWGRCGSYPGLEIRRDKSPEAVVNLREKFDMCYIDGDHSYDAVRADILACSEVVKPDGWIAGHDFPMPQVEKAVLSCVKAPILFRDGSWLAKNRIM